jgi:3-hydroxyacyl-CoA dehydrogenase
MTDPQIKTVAVVGTGTIGASWALLFTTHGLEVRLYDEAAGAFSRAEKFLDESMAVMVAANHLSQQEVKQAKQRLHLCATLEESLAGADFVQESAYESYDAKRPLFRRLDNLCPPHIILASSSSGLLMSEIQAGLSHPERCLIAHPFNPPHLIPLVELVPGPQTQPETLQRAKAFYLSLGKTPILLRKEVAGHIVNRLAGALWREAIDLAVQGVASVEDIDLAVSAGPGLRWALMGQHVLYHLAGGPGGMDNFLKHLGPAVESWWRDLATWTEFPPQASQVLIEGVDETLAGASYQELKDWRDEALLKLTDTVQDLLKNKPGRI